MKLNELPTPCLVLDRQILLRNVARMADLLAHHRVPLRPHMKTAKSIDVARLVLGDRPSGITVSTLAEAEYFASHGITDILYAVGITPMKLEQVAKLNAAGADVAVLTDDVDMARLIGTYPTPMRAMIEIDSGEQRGGVPPDDPSLHAIAEALGDRLVGIKTHAGHSYGGRNLSEITAIAEGERLSAVYAATQLRLAGYPTPIVSVGSSPTAMHAVQLEGVTEICAGVYMFGDLFQAEIGTHGMEDIAVTVMASVIGTRPERRQFLIDAGGLALSKDHSTARTQHDYGFGLITAIEGQHVFGSTVIARTYQEHGQAILDPALPWPELPIGTKVRVLPNHVCMTAAAHDRYYVVDGTDDVVAIWPRINGW